MKHEQYRHVTSHEELHTYLDWLRTFVGGDPLAHQGSLLEQYPDLDLRVRYTALAVALNHLSVLDDGCDAAEARRDLSHWGLSVLARLHKPLPADEQPRPSSGSRRGGTGPGRPR